MATASVDRFLGVGKVPYRGQHPLVELQVFRCAASRNYQGIVAVGCHVVPVDGDRVLDQGLGRDQLDQKAGSDPE